MDELEGRGQFSVERKGYVVQHSEATEDGPVPVLPWHLFLGEVGMGHLEDIPTGAFDESVSALSLGRSSDDLGLVVVDPSDALAIHDFAVKVRVELAVEVANVRPELGEGVDDFVERGGLEAVEPAVSGFHIN